MAATWEYGAVAFLDVLGFADFVSQDARAPVPQHLNRLLDCLEDVLNTTPAAQHDLRAFSDSITLSAPLSPESIVQLVESVVGLQRTFVRRSVLVRGAIALGKHFASPGLVYSEALVKAYQLERSQARFPRILFEGNLLDWFLNDDGCAPELKARMGALLLRDEDTQVFVHYLTDDLITHHMALIDSYEPERVTASVLEKIQWLASYHNHCVTARGGEGVISGPLVAGIQRI